MTSEMNSPLTSEQRRRALALREARSVLASTTGLFGGNAVGPKFDVHDIITLAEWILDPDPEDAPARSREDEWKAGFSEGAHSAVNRYRQLIPGDSPETGDRVLNELPAEDDVHVREPSKPEFLPGDDLRAARSDADDGV